MKRSALESQCLRLSDQIRNEEYWRNNPDRTIEIMCELLDRRSHIERCIMLLVINTLMRHAGGIAP